MYGSQLWRICSPTPVVVSVSISAPIQLVQDISQTQRRPDLFRQNPTSPTRRRHDVDRHQVFHPNRKLTVRMASHDE